MRDIRCERHLFEITAVHEKEGFVTVKAGQIEESVLMVDLDKKDPRVGDRVMLTYFSNGDIHGKWIRPKGESSVPF
jgi:hypothetical protein